MHITTPRLSEATRVLRLSGLLSGLRNLSIAQSARVSYTAPHVETDAIGFSLSTRCRTFADLFDLGLFDFHDLSERENANLGVRSRRPF